jgi:hypothetical protein
VFGPAVGSGKKCVLAGEREWADRALNHIGVDLDATIIEEQAEPGPA